MLWGDRAPSGRTADTWAYDLTTAASYANAGMEGVGKYSDADGLYPADGTTNGNLDTPYTYEQVSYVDYAEGIYIGYKWYETADAEATGMPRATSTAPAMMPLCSIPSATA